MTSSTQGGALCQTAGPSRFRTTPTATRCTAEREVESTNQRITRHGIGLPMGSTESLSPEEASSGIDWANFMVTANGSTSQVPATQGDASLRETQKALIEQFSKLKSPTEVVEFITESPMDFQKLFVSIGRMNDSLTDQIQQLNNQVDSQSQRIEVLESSEGRSVSSLSFPPKFASDVPRLVRLGGLLDDGEKCYRLHCFPEKVPAVLHTSKESR